MSFYILKTPPFDTNGDNLRFDTITWKGADLIGIWILQNLYTKSEY